MAEKTQSKNNPNSKADEVVEYFASLSGENKVNLLRKMGVIAIYHVNRDKETRKVREYVFPEHAGHFGPALPGISMFLTSLENATKQFINGNVEITNPKFLQAMSKKTYRREYDEEGKPIGEDLGIIEQISLMLNDQRKIINAAVGDAWTGNPRRNYKPRTQKGKNKPKETKKAEKKADAKPKVEKKAEKASAAKKTTSAAKKEDTAKAATTSKTKSTTAKPATSTAKKEEATKATPTTSSTTAATTPTTDKPATTSSATAAKTATA